MFEKDCYSCELYTAYLREKERADKLEASILDMFNFAMTRKSRFSVWNLLTWKAEVNLLLARDK